MNYSEASSCAARTHRVTWESQRLARWLQPTASGVSSGLRHRTWVKYVQLDVRLPRSVCHPMLLQAPPPCSGIIDVMAAAAGDTAATKPPTVEPSARTPRSGMNMAPREVNIAAAQCKLCQPVLSHAMLVTTARLDRIIQNPPWQSITSVHCTDEIGYHALLSLMSSRGMQGSLWTDNCKQVDICNCEYYKRLQSSRLQSSMGAVASRQELREVREGTL